MKILYFEDSNSFEKYMKEHLDDSSFWLKISKKNEPKLTAEEAVEIALCYGWIDSTNKRVDDSYYIKYFAKRRIRSVWSTKNKLTVARLIRENRMHEAGLKAVEAAKTNGCWDQADLPPIDFNMENFKMLLSKSAQAYEHYLSMSPSVQKTYALSYYTLKTKEARARRLNVIVTRLEQNLKPN